MILSMLYSSCEETQFTMHVKVHLLKILLILCIFQNECIAIKCYQCNSKNDQDCTLNRVHFKYLKLCPSDHPYCRKAVYMYYFMDSHNHLTLRECAKSRNSQKECYRGRYGRDSYQLVCECVGYGCNRSRRCSASHAVYFLCMLFAIVDCYITKRCD